MAEQGASSESKKKLKKLRKLKEQVREILQSAPKGQCTLGKFFADYKQSFGVINPHQYGVSKPSHVLSLIPDTCRSFSKGKQAIVQLVTAEQGTPGPGEEQKDNMNQNFYERFYRRDSDSSVGSRDHSHERGGPGGAVFHVAAAQGGWNNDSDFPELSQMQQQQNPPQRSRAQMAAAAGSFGTQNVPRVRGMQPFAFAQQPINPSPRGYHGHAPQRARVFASKEQLDRVVEDSIDRLAEAGEYVAVEHIESLILQHFDATSLNQLGIHRLENIPSVNQHLRKQAKMNAYVQAFVRVRSISTLHELRQNLGEFVAEGKDFDELKLGPLTKQPVIYEFFKFPDSGEIPPLTTGDLLEHLRGFLTDKDAWTKRDTKVEEFLTYLTEKCSVDSPYELGVRIRSLPLATSVLKKAQRECGQSVRSSLQLLKDNVMRELSQAFRQFGASMFERDGEVCRMREHYMLADAATVFEEVSAKLNVLMESLNYLQQVHQVQHSNRKQWNKSSDSLAKFSSCMRTDPLLRQLFQVAVCLSREEIHIQLRELLTDQSAESAESPGTTTATKQPPPLDMLITSTIRYIDRCLAHGGLNLTNLARIENKLLEDQDFPSFEAMGHGSFLDFMLKNAQLHKIIEDSGGGMSGMTSGGGTAESIYHASMPDLIEFVQQTGITDAEQCELIEAALCQHYGIGEVKALGHGSTSNLLKSAARQHTSSSNTSVFYESAICTKNKFSWFGNSQKVGIMGHQTKEKALSCLQKCPLLKDLADWSHWELVFRPELGDLKEFIQKYGGVYSMHISDAAGRSTLTTHILALETRPGQLLKATSDTNPEKFAEAAMGGRVSDTCGHLASLIIANKGTENTPLVLLGNHVKTALLHMQAAEGDGSIVGFERRSTVVQFVLECLCKLPFILAQATASQVFLEPLTHVIGASRSKELLLQYAVQAGQLSRMQLLGCLLGINEWARTFDSQLEVPEDCLTRQTKTVEEEVIMIADDEGSDAEADSSDSDSDDTDFLETSSDEDEEMDKSPKKKEEAKADTADAENGVEVVDTSPECITLNDTDDAVTETSQESEIAMDTDEPAVSSSTTEENDPCRLVIETIRRDEFGVGVELSEDGRKLMTKQQERLGRSLDRLSKDLYSKDTHFVLELIQNADDNDYDDSNRTPSVKFVVDEKGITVMNNECGFQEKNIRAICDVGKSTKGKHKFGYIGQKGIGFKSVFRVTDTPQIHSAGYHLQFDVNSGPMGYILPHWIGELAPENPDNWTTQIVLPLKSELQTQTQSQSLAARFQDVHPSLLLFLHRLKSIVVWNQVQSYTQVMQRQDLGNDVVEIQHNSGTDRWLVIRKTLDASHISLQAKSGVEVESTEIALAFPLPAADSQNMKVLPTKQPVFAFLPLRSYGFRFIVQGDFDVPSSREDVDKDSLWNQWLRNEIPGLFVEALEIFKSHPELEGLRAVCLWLQFVPLEDEVLDFFQPVASSILNRLRAQPCLPTKPAQGRSMHWKLPSQVVAPADALQLEVVTATRLQACLSLFYLHPDISSFMNPALVAGLGIQTLSTSHLLEVGKHILQEINQKDVMDLHAEVVVVAKWLACVYRSMDEFHTDEEIMKKLRSLPMIPLVTGQFVALQDSTVFFPLDAEERHKREANAQDPLFALERDLNTVHPALLQTGHQVASSQAARLLEQLGVKKLAPNDVIQHHILPVLKSDQWKSKPAALVVAYVVYLKEQLERQPSLVNMEQLRSIVVLATNKGMVRPSEQPVHFPVMYGNSVDLPRQLPGLSWTLVDICYLRSAMTTMDAQRWTQFLTQLGVLELLAVKAVNTEIKAADIASSPWASVKDFLPDPAGTYQVADYQCSQLVSLVQENLQAHTLQGQMSVLFEMLDRHWDKDFSRYKHAALKDSAGNLLREVPSSFAMNLQKLPWLPGHVKAVTSDPSGRVVSQKQLCLRAGGDLWLHSPNVEQLLADHVAYLGVAPSPSSSFLAFLGVRSVVTVEFLVERLEQWSVRSEAEQPSELISSLTHMKAVYLYLQSQMPPATYQELFRRLPCIFVPLSHCQDTNQIVGGHMLKPSEVRWADPRGLFEKYSASLKSFHLKSGIKPALQPLYGDLKEIFQRSALVPPKPDINEYAELLVHIATTNPVSRVLLDVLNVLSILGKELLNAQEKSRVDGEHLEKQLKALALRINKEACLPCKSGDWVALEQLPYIADDRMLEEMFHDKPDVFFVDLGLKALAKEAGQRSRPYGKNYGGQGQKANTVTQETLQAALLVLGVGRLSENVRVEETTESYKPCPDLQHYVGFVMPFIQKLLHTEYEEVYAKLTEEQNIHSRIATMQFGSVGKLEVVYSLKDKPDVLPVIKPEKCILTERLEFYIHMNSINNYVEVNKELARFFSQGDSRCMRTVRNLLLDIGPLVDAQSDALDRFMYQEGICDLPESEALWEVPKPPPMPEIEERMEVEVSGSGMPEGPQQPSAAWPPKSAYMGGGGSFPPGPRRPASEVSWPPPAPPSYMPRPELPAGLRPSSLDQPAGLEQPEVSTAAGGSMVVVAQGAQHQGPGMPGHAMPPGATPHPGPPGAGRMGHPGQGHPGQGQPGAPGTGAAHQGIQDGGVMRAGSPHPTGQPGGHRPVGHGPHHQDHLPRVNAEVEAVQAETAELSVNEAAREQPEGAAESMGPPGHPAPRPKGSHKRPRVESGGSVASDGPNFLLHFDMPVWTEEVAETPYEELGQGQDLGMLEATENVVGEDQDVIGRWGELLVYQHLQRHSQQPGSKIARVTWVNQEKETGLPYDLKVTEHDEETLVANTIFIEVKSTISDKKMFFDMSVKEVKFAQDLQENYHLYRVFNAGNASTVRLTKLQNLALLMEKKLVRLCLAV